MHTSAKIIYVEDIRLRRIPRAPLYIVREARGVVRLFLIISKYISIGLAAFLLSLFQIRGFVAFEAHVVDVKAEIARVEAPIINHFGGTFLTPVEVVIKSPDPDVSFVYYVILAGDDPSIVENPTCAGTFGGTNPQGPITISFTSVAKAVACVGDTFDSPHGPVTTEVYRFVAPEPEEEPAEEEPIAEMLVVENDAPPVEEAVENSGEESVPEEVPLPEIAEEPEAADATPEEVLPQDEPLQPSVESEGEPAE